MKRKIYTELLKWKKEDAGRTALLIDGARRVGKSYIVDNVINLRKRTMPDIITPLYRVKIFGIALDMESS